MVTALLCHLLEKKQIDGAWVSKSVIQNGKLEYKTFVATTREEIMNCASSIYLYMPLLRHINEIMLFDGRIAVVMLPCQLKALSRLTEKNKIINNKIVIKIGLYCSGVQNINGILLPLQKNKIDIKNANRIIYRKGHWRGETKILYEDGNEKAFSYTKNIGAYKNAYFFQKEKCFLCQDHFGKSSDISFGDVWLKKMRN
jgi:coenzyme F420-reducing hydrogenase beta subunit